MTTFDDSLTISTILITVIVLPWVLFLFIPAFLQVPIGNSVALDALEMQGSGFIIAAVGAIILLILLAGAWLE